MTNGHAKQILADMIRYAVEYDRRGDVVMRDQEIRNISDIPLSNRTINAALKKAGLKW